MTQTLETMEPLADEAAGLLKALSHPARLMICCQLRDREMSVSEIESALDIRQPRLSRELAKLREEGLVDDVTLRHHDALRSDLMVDAM